MGFLQLKQGVETLKWGKGGSDKQSWFLPLPPPSGSVCCNFELISPLKRPIQPGFKWLVVFIEVAALDSLELNFIFIKCWEN